MPGTLHFEFAAPDAIPEAARLVAHSFPGLGWSLPRWEEQLRDPLYGGGPETLFLARDAGRCVAACQLHPLRQWVGGAALPTAGVGTVAVAPTHRKRGG